MRQVEIRRASEPQLSSVSCIERLDHILATAHIDDAIDDDWGRAEPIGAGRTDTPGDSESSHVIGVDLLQGTEALLVVRASIHHPVRAHARVRLHALSGHITRSRSTGDCGLTADQKRKRDQSCAFTPFACGFANRHDDGHLFEAG